MLIFTQKPGTLKHFTNVYCLRTILRTGFRFSIPANWEDENDAALIKLYEEQKRKKVFVFCLCKGGETLHHWSYYGNNSNISDIEGRAKCCIKLNRTSFLQALNEEKYIIRDIQYKYISDLENGKYTYTIDDLITLKRKAYSVDDELRIIDLEDNMNSTPPTFDIKPYIDKIVLDGKLSHERYLSLSQSLMNEFPFLEQKIEHSTLYRSTNWIKAAVKISSQQSKHTKTK